MSLFIHHTGLTPYMVSTPALTSLKYLYYPVLGQQARPLCRRVFIHSSDVLARPCPLAVQVEAISVRPSLDHAQTWSQVSTHLLKDATEDKTSVVIHCMCDTRGYTKTFAFKNTSTMVVCS